MTRHTGPTIEDVPPLDDAAQELEWRVQESAMRGERLNPGLAGEDERARHYLAIARVLREPWIDELRPDFVARVAARARATPSSRVEQALLIVLFVALAIISGASIVAHGREWNLSSNVWLMAVGACIGASWLMERWQWRDSR